MIQNVLVLGAGSAGLLAAITLRKKLPQLAVRLVRSTDIGVIGVGEGTTVALPKHLFSFLGLSQQRFYAEAEPIWKLGIRFIWGPRPYFDYTFSYQLDGQWSSLTRPNGFYAGEEFRGAGVASALMEAGKVFLRDARKGGVPDMSLPFGFHIENLKLVAALEKVAMELGVEFVEGKVSGVEKGPEGIAAVCLEDGRREAADFFVDASGFRGELVERALEEPFVSYDRALFCDRAVIGGWERTDEPIAAYTTAETMEAGWAWQIEHEHHVNRGYVYSSPAISDEAACEEFLRKNPKAPQSPRVVKFRSGRLRRMWVDNVVAIGNSAGFVEPLEASALETVVLHSQHLVTLLEHAALQPTPTLRAVYNQFAADIFDEIRDFLALHYQLNTRLENPFWEHCRRDTDLGRLGPVLEFYRENGPSALVRHLLPTQFSNFGVEGYLAMLVGNRAPYQARAADTAAEQQAWQQVRAMLAAQAQQGYTVAEALEATRSPHWRWNT